jgi:hypothetical protein
LTKRGRAGSSKRRADWRKGWSRRRAFLIGGTAVAAVAALVALSAMFWLNSGGSTGPKHAAIVDQLSTTAPNPDFVATTTKTLEHAGYVVDYFAGDSVTVEFYRHLPEHHYALVVLRAHSGLTTVTNVDTGAVTHTKSVSLFTSQPFDSALYQSEQDAGRLGHSRYLEDGLEVKGVFGIEPDFVRSSMLGRFDGTLVVLMGCNGLDAPSMANAFLDKGASTVVGWSDFVSAGHTDATTSRLLEKIFDGGVAIRLAVEQTSRELGPDPQFGGSLQVVTKGT